MKNDDEKPDYIVISNNTKKSLAETVNEKMKEGYVPCGGISLGVWKYSLPSYIQAMILKYK